jgi:hypothetical protein
MARYSPGDQVICKISDNRIASMYEDHPDYKHIFEIISIYDEGYFVYVPQSVYLKDTIEINKSNYRKFNVLKRFVGGQAYYITDFKICDLYKKSDGVCCVRCTDFFYLAEPNQPDGTLICFLCRQNRFR